MKRLKCNFIRLAFVCRYRVLAFDHDLLSFSDLRFEKWPAVLITNPKDAQYLHPGVEPLGRIRRSTHIRFVFEVSRHLFSVAKELLLLLKQN